MPRPDFGKEFMISEGLDDYHAPDMPGSTGRNIKYIDGKTVMRITALVANSLPWDEVDSPSLIWLAPRSLGDRYTDGERVATLDPDSDIYAYHGYNIESATVVGVGSGTSGASILMERIGFSDDWEASFEDPNGESRMYRSLFSHIGHASLWDLTKPEVCWGDIEPYDLADDTDVERAA